jgi:hypothetical protein
MAASKSVKDEANGAGKKALRLIQLYQASQPALN